MASLYKKPVVMTDPKTGQRAKTQSKKWWGQFRDAEGRLRRCPLAVDKQAAQAMLNDLVRQVEREKAGLVDPTDRERKRRLAEHVAEYGDYLAHKGITDKQRSSVLSQLGKVVTGCKWQKIADINAGSTMEFLAKLRRDGRSAQTYNNYLRAAKSFTRWLVRDRRTPTDPLVHLARVNVAADRRHDRRALSQEEFSLLVEAARAGGRIEGVSGEDRAMLYVLAAWTGFRKGELGSLTLCSFQLDAEPPTATVEACYSKHRREDRQVLHPEVVRLLKEWLAKKNFKPTSLLFSISGRVPGGIERKTNKMIRLDLAAARDQWLDAAPPDQRRQRETSDFLCYKNAAGRYVDFHSLRHFFITSLERAGVSPKMAQTLARHSDIRLTLGVYTHVELQDQTAAIGALAGPVTPRPSRLTKPIESAHQEL